ncbi:MAG: hypothetical protein F7B18_04240 [Desulfurococcales archaeon]|nr:hypothetical protein [Desulfurococcales archaeon]
MPGALHWLLPILLLAQATIIVNVDQKPVEGRIETRVTIQIPSKLILGKMNACLNGSKLIVEGWSSRLYMASVEVNATIQGGEARGLIRIDTGITRAEADYAVVTASDKGVVIEILLVPPSKATANGAQDLEEALESLPLVRDARVEESSRGYWATITLDPVLRDALDWQRLTLEGFMEKAGNYSMVAEASTRSRARLLLEIVARSWMEASARDSWIVDPVIQVLDRSRQACINIDHESIVVEATLFTYTGNLKSILPQILLEYLNTTDKPQGGATPTQETPVGKPIVLEPGYGMLLAVALITLAITGKIVWGWARLSLQS